MLLIILLFPDSSLHTLSPLDHTLGQHMARPWDNTLYVESHYPAFSPRPKYPECSGSRVPVVLWEFAPSVAVASLPVAPTAARLVLLDFPPFRLY